MKKLYQNNDCYLVFRVFDRENDSLLYDLSGITNAQLTITDCVNSDSDPVITLPLGASMTVVNNTELRAKLTRTQTKYMVGVYFMQLDIWDANSDKSTVYQGHVYFATIAEVGSSPIGE